MRHAAAEDAAGSITFDVIDLVLSMVLVGLFIKAWHMVRQRGGLRAVLEQQQRRQFQQQQRRALHEQQQARVPPHDFDHVVAALQRLPTEVVASKEDLERETIHELKERLRRLAIDCAGCVEKAELVAKLIEAGGSSGESCAICAEEYASGDVVRVLPCKHLMHLECVDRWLLKSTEHSAPKGCPLCNDERWLTAAGAPA